MTTPRHNAEIDTAFYDENADREFNVRATGFVSPYDPGITWGPPERCYPPEGGELEDYEVLVEIGPTTCHHGGLNEVRMDEWAIIARFGQDWWQHLESRLFEESDPHGDCYEPDWERFDHD